MDQAGVLLCVVVLYTAMVTGIYIKIRVKGVKTAPLVLSLLIPVLIPLIICEQTKIIIQGSEETRWQKVRHIAKLLLYTVQLFPILIGLIGIKLAMFERSLSYRKTTSRQIKIVKEFFPQCYGNLLIC